MLLAIDGAEVADLCALSDLLKTLESGQTLKATVRRGESEMVVEVTVVAR